MMGMYVGFVFGILIGMIITKRKWADNANHVWTMDGRHKVISSKTYHALFDEIRKHEDKEP